MKAREWIDQGLNRNPDLMDLLKDFPLQDGETETRDMRTREQREIASARQMASRYTVQLICFSGTTQQRFEGVGAKEEHMDEIWGGGMLGNFC